MERLTGEVVAVATVEDGLGGWRLAAIANTDRGPVAGVLCVPPTGGTGQLGFHPTPELTAACSALPAWELLEAQRIARAESPNPNDPRGLKKGGAGARRPGMTS